METVLSGVDEASCREAFSALDQGEGADWWPSARLFEELQRKASDFAVVWFYGSPAWVASQVPQGESLEAALDAWIRRNRAILNLRPALGPRLRLVNIEAVAGSGPAVHAETLYRALLGWWGPTYQGMYEVLEAAAWRPLGGVAPHRRQPGESQLLAAIEGFIGEVQQACESTEASKADALLARLQETQEDLETVLQERDRLLAQVAIDQQDHDDGVVAREQLVQQVRQARQQLAEREAEAREAQRAHRALAGKLATAEGELQRILREHEALAGKLATAQAALARVRQQLEAGAAKQKELEGRVATEITARRKLSAQLAASKDTHATLDQQYAKMQQDYNRLRSEYRELKARNIEAMRELRDLAPAAGREPPAIPAGNGLRQGVVRLIPGLRRRQQAPTLREREAALELVAGSEWFDRDWYLAAYPDVAAAGLDPVAHYLDFGWKEFRNPGPNFDTTYYLTHNIDVAKSGLSPLVHFIRFGAVEGRRPQHGVSNA